MRVNQYALVSALIVAFVLGFMTSDYVSVKEQSLRADIAAGELATCRAEQEELAKYYVNARSIAAQCIDAYRKELQSKKDHECTAL